MCNRRTTCTVKCHRVFQDDSPEKTLFLFICWHQSPDLDSNRADYGLIFVIWWCSYTVYEHPCAYILCICVCVCVPFHTVSLLTILLCQGLDNRKGLWLLITHTNLNHHFIIVLISTEEYTQLLCSRFHHSQLLLLEHEDLLFLFEHY